MTYATPEFDPDEAYALALPHERRPIVVIGAGGIVHDAHLPAYRKAGYAVHALCDRDLERARRLAAEFDVALVFDSVPAAIAAAPADAVFDIALPPEHFADVLEHLPDGAPVLLQKPLGNHAEQTRRIVETCRRKGLVAAVNTQLRFCPYVAAARSAIAAGRIGELYDLEVQVEVNTPWELFPYVRTLERIELNMHSVHYIDLVRSFLGDPQSVSCVTVGQPGRAHANTRSDVIHHYGARPVRAIVATNHDHRFGPRYEQSSIKWEGTRGAIRAQMGLLLDYPRGREDSLEMYLDDDPQAGWQPLPFHGTWFPDAFIGSMGALLRYLEGSVPSLPTGIEDVRRTMAVVEAAYDSSARGGVAPAYA